MTRSPSRTLWSAVAVLLSVAPAARADINIVLQNEFIEHYKRRVTIDTTFIVDKAHRRPNAPSKDGDLHVAGRADEVKLPIVAEIMNARDDPQAVAAIHAAEGRDSPVELSGAWRLWCEHAGGEQVQGRPLRRFTSTNPDHVFEVHPVTRLNGRDLSHTLKPIPGFRTKDAHDAFAKYESLRCQIIPDTDRTTLVTTMAGFNYVEFVMELNQEAVDSDDGGLLVLCKVRDLEGELLVRNRRMVLPPGSRVEQQVRGKPAGTRVHVLGLPRINLSLVSWRTQAAAEGRTDVLTWTLPYEIIVVGFYNFVEADEDEADPDERPLVVRPKGKGVVPRTLTEKEIEGGRKSTAPPSPAVQVDGPGAKGSPSAKGSPKAKSKSKGKAKATPKAPAKPFPDPSEGGPPPRVVSPKGTGATARPPKVADLIEEK